MLDPELQRSLMELGMVREVRIRDGEVTLTLALTVPTCPLRDQIAAQARAAVLALEGVREVRVELTEMTEEEKRRIGLGGPGEPATAHYLEEAERLCDRIAIIVRGRIVALDTVDGLKARAPGRTTVEVTVVGGDGRVETLRSTGDHVEAAVQAALKWAVADGRQVLAVNTVRPTLEDVFVQLTGLSAEVMLAEKGKT